MKQLKNNHQLFKAITENDIAEFVHITESQKVELNEPLLWQQPIFHAVSNNSIDIVKQIIKQNINININPPQFFLMASCGCFRSDYTATSLAIDFEYEEIEKLLKKHGGTDFRKNRNKHNIKRKSFYNIKRILNMNPTDAYQVLMKAIEKQMIYNTLGEYFVYTLYDFNEIFKLNDLLTCYKVFKPRIINSVSHALELIGARDAAKIISEASEIAQKYYLPPIWEHEEDELYDLFQISDVDFKHFEVFDEAFIDASENIDDMTLEFIRNNLHLFYSK